MSERKRNLRSIDYIFFVMWGFQWLVLGVIYNLAKDNAWAIEWDLPEDETTD